ncbi:MAG: hypothetical protein Q9174_000182 [Haloplaca sp. 1 TL-2023]
MSALVNYGSSEEDDENEERPQNLGTSAPSMRMRTNDEVDTNAKVANGGETSKNILVGPQTRSTQRSDEESPTAYPLSPFSTNRLAIRNLTLPPIPKLDIPPSPPGSSPAATIQKFEHFMQLKRQKVHFNEKLAGSSALRNPSLLQKLMASAGLEETEQYATTLPQALLDPSAFPECAYKEELAKSQKRLTGTREAEGQGRQRENVDFVRAAKSDGQAATNVPLSTFQSNGSRSSL